MADTDPEIRGGPGPPKNVFRPLGPHFGLKVRGRGQAPRTPPLDPPLIYGALKLEKAKQS